MMHAQALFFNHLYAPISLVRDTEVKAAMCSLGVHCQSFNGDVLYEPWEVLAESARPFTSFATFWSRSSLLLHSLCLQVLHANLAQGMAKSSAKLWTQKKVSLLRPRSGCMSAWWS